MYDIDAALDRQILRYMRDRPVVILSEPKDPRIIEAACRLPRFARLLFLASEECIRKIAASALSYIDPNRLRFTLAESRFLDLEEAHELKEELAQAFVRHHAALGEEVSLETARQEICSPPQFAIMAVKEGYADMMVAGLRYGPRAFFRPMLKMLSAQPVLSEVGIFILPDSHGGTYPHNIVAFGDVGVNASMNPEILAQVAVGTCAVARDILSEEILPEIHGSIVSYSHKGSDEGPSPERIREAMKLIPCYLKQRIARGARYRNISIEGEVKVNVALSTRSAHYYHGDQKWAGKTNVIIAPNLDLGNFLFHLYASRYPEARKLSLLYGVRFRAVDLPMDGCAEDVCLSIKANLLRLQRYGHWHRTPKDLFFPRYRILSINPGSTSTKLAIFEGEQAVISQEIQHSAEELAPFEGQRIVAQYELRKGLIEEFLKRHQLNLEEFDAFAGRGGLLKAIPHGTYAVNEAMQRDLLAGVRGDHASNLGGLIARALAGPKGAAFIVDPVVVDETEERVKITGIKEIRRRVASHALNQIATAHRYATEHESFYEALNLIICHMGGGITIGAHKQGRYIDVNNGLDGEGPFTPQRSGSLPPGQLIDLCYSGKYSLEEIKALNKGKGGLIDLLGNSDFRSLEARLDRGDDWAQRVFEAMSYQIAKGITALLPAFDGMPVDQILLTGGLARSERLIKALKRSLTALSCGVSVYPGENELYALAKGALRVLSGREPIHEYRSDPEVL